MPLGGGSLEGVRYLVPREWHEIGADQEHLQRSIGVGHPVVQRHDLLKLLLAERCVEGDRHLEQPLRRLPGQQIRMRVPDDARGRPEEVRRDPERGRRVLVDPTEIAHAPVPRHLVNDGPDLVEHFGKGDEGVVLQHERVILRLLLDLPPYFGVAEPAPDLPFVEEGLDNVLLSVDAHDRPDPVGWTWTDPGKERVEALGLARRQAHDVDGEEIRSDEPLVRLEREQQDQGGDDRHQHAREQLQVDELGHGWHLLTYSFKKDFDLASQHKCSGDCQLHL